MDECRADGGSSRDIIKERHGTERKSMRGLCNSKAGVEA